MAYVEKIERLQTAIGKSCNEIIARNYSGGYVTRWITMDATTEIPNIYVTEFTNDFCGAIDDQSSLYIATCGSRLVNHLLSLTSIQPAMSLPILLDYADVFIRVQLNDFFTRLED